MGKGYSEGRTPNDREGLIVLPDGSTYDPGFVTSSDGTMAAEEERAYAARIAAERIATKTEHLKQQPTYEEITREAQEQRQFYRSDVSPWRSASQERRAEENNVVFGRVVQLVANQKTQGVYTPEYPTERDWTIYIQPQLEANQLTPFPGPGYGNADLSSIIANLQWMVGGCTFQRVIVLRSCAVTRFPLVARKVMIDLTAFKDGDPTLGGKTFQVNLGVGQGKEHEVFSTSPLWIPQSTLPFGFGGSGPSQKLLPNTVVPVSIGFLMQAVVIAKALPAGGAPFYPMFFNQTTAPVGGDIPFVTLSPLTAAGGFATLDDEFVTALDFDIGLAFGVSTTPDVYTAPAAGVVVRLDFKVGT